MKKYGLHIRGVLLLAFLFIKGYGAIASDTLRQYSIHELGFFMAGGIASVTNADQYREHSVSYSSAITSTPKYYYSAGISYTVHAHRFVSLSLGVAYRIFERNLVYFSKVTTGSWTSESSSSTNLRCEMLYVPLRLNLHFGGKRTKAYITLGPDFSPFVMAKNTSMYWSGSSETSLSRTWLTGLMFGVGVEHLITKGIFVRAVPMVNFVDLANAGFSRPTQSYEGFKSLNTYLVGIHVEFGFLIGKANSKV